MNFGSKYVYARPEGCAREGSDEEVRVRDEDNAQLSMSQGSDDDDGETCVLDIFDTAGQEEYSSMRETYVRSGDGFIVVYSVTDPTSLQEAESMVNWLSRFRDKKDLHVVLCANKIDLSAERKVSPEEGQKLADSLGVPYFETSAKTGENVTKLYHGLVKIIPRTGTDYKVVMLGSGAVGKSSLTIRFTQDTFMEDYDPTIEDSFRKMIQVQGQAKGDRKVKKRRLRKALDKARHKKTKSKSRQSPRVQSASMVAAGPSSQGGAARGGGGLISSIRRVFSSRGSRRSQQQPPPQMLQHMQQQQLQGPMASDSDSDSDSDDDGRGRRRTAKATHVAKQRKTDGNVVLLSLGKLGEEPNLMTGDPLQCGDCRAVLSATSLLTPQPEGKKAWTCEFCGKVNADLDIEDEEVPKGESFDFMLEPAPEPEAEGAADAAVDVVEDKKKKVTTGRIIYCMDISSSMGMSCEIPEFQAAWRQDRTRGQSAALNVSRLHCIKEAVQRQLQQLHLDEPDKEVMVAVFGSDVFIKGGGDLTRKPTACSADGVIGHCDKATYEQLLDKGMKLATEYPLKPLSDSFVALDASVGRLLTNGCTALGPALTLCAGFLSDCPSSEIVLCTDGAPNVGVGNINRDGPEFYKKVGEYAKANKTVINILAVEGEPVGLPVVQTAAEVSGGTVNVLNPLEIVRQLRQITQNALVATAVTATYFLHPEFVFDEPGYPDDTSRLSKELGNVMKEDDLTFRFKPKDPNTPPQVEQVPFQVQITYTRRDGMKCLRVLSKANKATTNRKDMEEGINVAVLGTAAVKKTAALAQAGDVKTANAHLKAVKRLAKRGAQSSDQKEELSAFRDECADLDEEIVDNLTDWSNAKGAQAEARSKMLFAKSKMGMHQQQSAASKKTLSKQRVMQSDAKDMYYGHQF